MELPREVMDDLMVLYLGGEASAETRRLVEDYAAAHPDYRNLLERAGQPLPAPPPAKDKEMETLKMTRQFIRLRTLFFAGAVFFTLLPFTIVVRKGEITFLMFRDVPGIGPAFWSVAAASWIACFIMHRSVRKSGL